MSYADITFYRDVYKGESIADDQELQKTLDRATDDIDFIQPCPIVVDDLSEERLNYLKMANCAQAEGYVLYGFAGTPDSFSLGKFSMSGGSTGSKQSEGALNTRATRYLYMACLFYRGSA